MYENIFQLYYLENSYNFLLLLHGLFPGTISLLIWEVAQNSGRVKKLQSKLEERGRELIYFILRVLKIVNCNKKWNPNLKTIHFFTLLK